MNQPTAIALLVIVSAYVAFLLSRGMRRDAPPDAPDPPEPLPEARVRR